MSSATGILSLQANWFKFVPSTLNNTDYLLIFLSTLPRSHISTSTIVNYFHPNLNSFYLFHLCNITSFGLLWPPLSSFGLLQPPVSDLEFLLDILFRYTVQLILILPLALLLFIHLLYWCSSLFLLFYFSLSFHVYSISLCSPFLILPAIIVYEPALPMLACTKPHFVHFESNLSKTKTSQVDPAWSHAPRSLYRPFSLHGEPHYSSTIVVDA